MPIHLSPLGKKGKNVLCPRRSGRTVVKPPYQRLSTLHALLLTHSDSSNINWTLVSQTIADFFCFRLSTHEMFHMPIFVCNRDRVDMLT